LLIVGPDGQPVGVEEGLLARFQETVNAHSNMEKWFQVGALRGDFGVADEMPGEPVLLAARWLCHLSGLRHRTVEIFLDLPGVEEGHTLVQVRGMDKIDGPGAFDFPCAGHAVGTETAQEALRKELGEELNLAPEDLEDLHLVARYIHSAHTRTVSLFYNEEYRYLHRARIKPAAVPHIRFHDGEVGALALFNYAELCALAERFPERIASGLGDALGYYLDH
ncbi:MAG: NUDIX domain-containing protein, partial [Anaerolineaceae bacterium]|nr:NUDIX domain-containing protein [Anaerolineaceae bacterium]